MLSHEVLDAVTPDEVIRVGEVDLLNGDLVGGDGVGVIRDALGDPVVTGDDFHVPNVVFVREKHGIAGRRAVLFDQLAQILNGVAGAFNERQGHVDDEIFVQAVFDQRIKSQGPFVAVSRFGRGHGHVFLVDPGFFVVAFVLGVNVGHRVVAVAVFRQIGLKAVERGFHVQALLPVPGWMHVKPVRCEDVERVVVARDHGAAVDTGIFPHQNGRASRFNFHSYPSFLMTVHLVYAIRFRFAVVAGWGGQEARKFSGGKLFFPESIDRPAIFRKILLVVKLLGSSEVVTQWTLNP